MMTHTYTHISGRATYSTSRNASIIHTQVAIYRNLVDDDAHIHTHPFTRLIACTNTYFSLTFTGAFPLHGCGVTRSLGTYFISVRLVFLLEMIVLQSVL